MLQVNVHLPDGKHFADTYHHMVVELIPVIDSVIMTSSRSMIQCHPARRSSCDSLERYPSSSMKSAVMSLPLRQPRKAGPAMGIDIAWIHPRKKPERKRYIHPHVITAMITRQLIVSGANRSTMLKRFRRRFPSSKWAQNKARMNMW